MSHDIPPENLRVYIQNPFVRQTPAVRTVPASELDPKKGLRARDYVPVPPKFKIKKMRVEHLRVLDAAKAFTRAWDGVHTQTSEVAIDDAFDSVSKTRRELLEMTRKLIKEETRKRSGKRR